MMNLTSSKDFGKLLKDKSDSEYRRLRENFDNFLEKPLKLGYFIPCDEEGDILEEPTNYEKRLLNMMTEYNDEVYTYYQAKAKVLFEGFEYDSENEWINYNGFSRFFISELQNGKIEDLHELITEKPKLTETAKKEIGYETT